MHGYDILEKGRPLKEAEKAVILLHGRGASAGNIISLADEFCDDSYYVAAPQAVNNTWYPFSFMADAETNEPWLSAAITLVSRLIDEIKEHVPVNRLTIMGFSQGACLALEASARNAQHYAGVAAFTGGLIGKQVEPSRYRGNFEGTKIFLGTSDKDPYVPLDRTEESGEVLENLGASVTLQVYPGMPHTIAVEEIKAARALLF